MQQPIKGALDDIPVGQNARDLYRNSLRLNANEYAKVAAVPMAFWVHVGVSFGESEINGCRKDIHKKATASQLKRLIAVTRWLD